MFRDRLIALFVTAALAAGGAGAIAVTAASASRPAMVELAPPKTKPGAKCRNGTSGCTHGKFTGTFFGD